MGAQAAHQVQEALLPGCRLVFLDLEGGQAFSGCRVGLAEKALVRK